MRTVVFGIGVPSGMSFPFPQREARLLRGAEAEGST
jgi:hypothetical protein